MLMLFFYLSLPPNRLSVFSSLSWGDILGENGRSLSRTSMDTIQEPTTED